MAQTFYHYTLDVNELYFLKGVGDAKILGFSLKTESSGYVFAINTALFINIL